jgi:hydroxymethylpyrimidine pyrophosphatase-like HAD family hydrolase
MTIELDGRCFAVSHEGDANELWAFNAATPDMIVTLDAVLAGTPSKVSVNGLGNDLTPIIEALRAALDGGSAVIPAVDNSFINVHHMEATKSRGVAALAGPHGIALSEVLSFGDDYPDLDLVQKTGWPVAVSNAIPEVRATARYLTASNDEDGVAIVLEDFLDALRRRS